MWVGKRAFDFVSASLGLIFLSPLFLFLSIWIKLTSRGPVFFRQERVGLGEKRFRIHKFRTMFIDSDKKGLALTVGTDSRITPVGKLLRKYKLDELPQLIDVFKGDMSIVGPRPEVPRYVEHYPKAFRKIIFEMRPGITDIASITFKDESYLLGKSSDPEKTYVEEVLPIKLGLASNYPDRASFLEDLRIIFLTFYEMFSDREGLSLLGSIANLKRSNKIFLMMATDFVILPLAFLTAIILREGTIDIPITQYAWILIATPIIMIPIYFKMGLYRAVIRHLDLKILLTISYGSSLGTLLIATMVALARENNLPRSSLGIFLVFSVMYVAASRLFARGLLLRVESPSIHKKRVAIYGAGAAGTQMAFALSRSRDYHPILFVDDDPEALHTSLVGMRVFSPMMLGNLVEKYSIDEILIAMPSIPRTKLKSIVESLEKLEVPIKILPGISDVLNGKVRVEQIRDIEIEDLLGRDQVQPNEELLQKCISGKVVCITGAGGSIGSELCRQVVKLSPSKVILLDQNEFGLYSIEKELLEMNLKFPLVSVLVDVCDEKKLSHTFLTYEIQTVYHAAAYKHVPLVEMNPSVGILNNAFGTLTLAKLAMDNKVENFILISTDKAVRPTNVMGASKRLAELILQGFPQDTKTIFSMVRFGNVLGSSGSVVPLFKDQIKRGGPVTVTHKDITRYFMSIPEAAQLVIQAGAMAKGGEVFVLDMGEPIKIYDLAKRMIELNGYHVKSAENPDGDIEIEVVGLRPGEKLYEELLISGDVQKTAHPRISMTNESFIPWGDLNTYLEDLKTLCEKENPKDLKLFMQKIIQEYKPQINL